ncbi:MAG: hypothetical protein NUV72_07205 [Bauldia sp.]|nr:hypothetical protein [Bauldia sp.]
MDGVSEPLPTDKMLGLLSAQAKQIRAARYVFHKVTAHRYALGVVRKEMTLKQAKESYVEAMRNYDGIIGSAPLGYAAAANDAETAKGADAIAEAVEMFQNG